MVCWLAIMAVEKEEREKSLDIKYHKSVKRAENAKNAKSCENIPP